MTESSHNFDIRANKAQKKAISHPSQYLLIVAGPGTGKTYTLIQRIRYFIDKIGESENILAITFSNKAATEMQDRVRKQWGEYQEKSFIGTFHSFSLSLLRQFIDKTGLPEDFIVKTPKEIEEYLKILWKQKTDKQIKDLIKDISLWKSTEFTEKEPEWVREYNLFLRELKILDFDDLLVEALRLLSHNDTILENVRRSYPFIFVDEYQDINAIQHSFLKLLISPTSYLTAIGDPNQAIYGFRGSDVLFFKKFIKEFPQSQCVTLNENYRSASNIVDASSQVINQSEFEVPDLTVAIYREGKLTLFHAVTERAEAEYVVHEIEKILGGISLFSLDSQRVDSNDDCEVSFSDIAIIYRLNAQRKFLEEALTRSGMPFQVSGDSSHYVIDDYEHNVEKIHLLTMHASKGLEFKAVFIIGCEDHLMPLNIEGLKANREEERRLFYVAMTRAQERLYFTTSQKRMLFGKFYENPMSPFLYDIDEKLKNIEKSMKEFKKKKIAKQLDLFG